MFQFDRVMMVGICGLTRPRMSDTRKVDDRIATSASKNGLCDDETQCQKVMEVLKVAKRYSALRLIVV